MSLQGSLVHQENMELYRNINIMCQENTELHRKVQNFPKKTGEQIILTDGNAAQTNIQSFTQVDATREANDKNSVMPDGFSKPEEANVLIHLQLSQPHQQAEGLQLRAPKLGYFLFPIYRFHRSKLPIQ